MDVKPAFDFAKAFLQRIQQIHANGLAAQLAFYFLLSLFPFLIFAVTLLPYIGVTGQQILHLLEQYAPNEATSFIERELYVIDRKQQGLLSFGIIAAIWSVSNAVNEMMRALNHAYDVHENRHFLVARGIAVLLTFGMILVIIIALLLPVFGKMIGEFIFAHLHLPQGFLTVWEVFRWVTSFSVIVIVFTLLYYFAPNKKLRLKDVFVGGIVATVGWQLSSYGFSYYVSNVANYSAMYGSIGGVIVLMLWFYITAFIIIIGGVINAVLDQSDGG